MAIAFVAERGSGSGAISSGGTFTQAVSSVTPGNLLVLMFESGGIGTGTVSVTGVTDTGGNSWTVAPNGTPGASGSIGSQIAYCYPTAAPGTITGQLSSGFTGGTHGAWRVAEWSGVGKFDIDGGIAHGGSAGTGTSGNLTPALGGELLIAAWGVEAGSGTVTSITSSGFTATGSVIGSIADDCMLLYKLSAASGSQNSSGAFSPNSFWGVTLVFFAPIPPTLIIEQNHIIYMRKNV